MRRCSFESCDLPQTFKEEERPAHQIVLPEIVKKFTMLYLHNRRVKVGEIVNTVSMSIEGVFCMSNRSIGGCRVY